MSWRACSAVCRRQSSAGADPGDKPVWPCTWGYTPLVLWLFRSVVAHHRAENRRMKETDETDRTAPELPDRLTRSRVRWRLLSDILAEDDR